MPAKIKIGISSCLLGNKVRYDGARRHDQYLTSTLGRYIDWVPVCPEVEYGLPVPREPMRLTGDPDSPRLVTIKTGIDHTDGMKKWAGKRLIELEKDGLCGFIFKSRSPSSGCKGIKVYSPSGVRKGTGIFADAFIRRFPVIPFEDESRLRDPKVLENFIGRAVTLKRWNEFLKERSGKGGLVSFHTENELLLMSHSPGHLTILDRMAAEREKYKKGELFDRYISLFMAGQRMTATLKKNQNVLLHVLGYFRKHLTSAEKAELHKTIERYHEGFITLIAPVTLINLYVRKFNEPYLKRQLYLNPHPLELMLRNHL